MAIGSDIPGEINNYRQFGTGTDILEDDQIPISVKNRKVTDKYFLVTFIVCILLLLPLIGYTLYYSDINRLLYGYDDCGNICGQLNVKYSQWDCTGKDMRDKPVYHNDHCRANLSTPKKITDDDYIHIFEPSDEFENNVTIRTEDFLDYIQRVMWKLITACLVSIVLCQCVVLLFRYATAMMVWTIGIASWILLAALCGRLWVSVAKTTTDDLLVPAIVVSVFLVVLLCIMIFMRKSIELVIMLLMESTQAVFDMPATFIVPFLVMIGGAIIATVFSVLTVYMFSSGILTEIYSNILEYQLNAAMITTIVWHFLIFLWVLEFIYGLQYMIISGAIARWYFNRDKSLLGSPVRTSAYITFRFHLGTVAFGSLILTLITLLRIILKSMAKNHRLKLIIDCCMNYLEAILRFFTFNSYIFTALHGTPFYTSGKKVTALLKMNLCNVMALNNIGNFVLRMSQIFLMLISYCLTGYVFLGGEEHDNNYYYCILIVVAITAISSFTILGTVEIAMDSMFVCFCEDCAINDGITKPYFMTRGLMQFVQKSKVVFAHTIQKKGLPTI